ncbi:MAG: patatin family protein, partial [Clostridiaceae bacterium]|nr:patatin family protein [Clostridiaceae bacterium]
MKLGLVLEGGGSRTYFTCGVLDCFLEEGTYADYVIGTSAGIANGV